MEISVVNRHFSIYTQFVEIHLLGEVRTLNVVYCILLSKDKNKLS